jgi:branched-chain amino acid transport system substrate-binding protein
MATRQRRSRRLIPAIVAGTAALTLAPLAVSAGAAASPKASGTVTIGVSEMLTGPSEYYGNAALTGVKLAVTYLNAHGGIMGNHVAITVQDDASLNSEAVSEVRSFAQDSNIPMIIAPTYQPNFESSCTVASSFNVPIVGAQSAPLTKAQNPNTDCFVVTSNVNVQAKDALKTLIKYDHIKSMTLVYDQTNAYVSEFTPVISNLAKSLGLTTQVLAVTSGQTDYGPQITKILSFNPSIIVPNMVTEDAARFMLQAREEKVTSLFVDLISELTNTRIYKLSNGKAAGLFAATPQSVGVPSFKAFVSLYTKYYGAPQDPTYAGFGYDSMMLIAKAMTVAHTITDRSAILKTLRSLKSMCGSICYSNEGGGAYLTNTVYYVTLTASGYVPAKL